MSSRRWPDSGDDGAVGTGWAALTMKAPERVPISRDHAVTDCRGTCGCARHTRSGHPGRLGKAVIGWETLPEKLQRDHRDLTIADVLRIQHLLGQKPHESGAARRQVLQGVSVDRTAFGGIPKLVIGAGLDRYVPEGGSERLADWLGADYEPLGHCVGWSSRAATSRWPIDPRFRKS